MRDTITVKGGDTKSFVMPYKMSNLSVQVDTGAGFVTPDNYEAVAALAIEGLR